MKDSGERDAAAIAKGIKINKYNFRNSNLSYLKFVFGVEELFIGSFESSLIISIFDYLILQRDFSTDFFF